MTGDWWGSTVRSWLYHTCCGVCRGSKWLVPCRLLCCPVRCLRGALHDGRRDGQEIYSQTAVLYLFVLFLATGVFNVGLIVAKPTKSPTPDGVPSPYNYVLVGYTVLYMWLSMAALAYMVYQARSHGAVCDRSAMRRTFYMRTGLYIFGLLSCGFNLCSFMNTIVCHGGCCGNDAKHWLYPVSDITVALLTVLQILFMNSYYKLRLPVRTPYVQLAYAHIIGSNLGLWVWTLCREVDHTYDKLCNHFPIQLDDRTPKIFYVVTVEYLLLVAVMFFENWSLLERSRDFSQIVQDDMSRRSLGGEAAQERDTGVGASNGVNSGTPLVLAFVATGIFLVLVIASSAQGKTYHLYYDLYLWFMLVFYITQIIACAIIQVCLQTQQPCARPADYDDFLLYISLAGILAWEGFHWYGLLSNRPVHVDVDEALVDLLGPVEYLAQTYILVSAKRYAVVRDRNARWIVYLALYMLVGNFAHWCQDSYFITGDRLEKPGERSNQLEATNFVVLAHILTPLIVFFRFHSATCFYHMWDMFNGRPRRVDITID